MSDLPKTTLVPSEWAAALRWRDKFLNEDNEQLLPLDAQIVAYLVADAEELRNTAARMTQLEADLAAARSDRETATAHFLAVSEERDEKDRQVASLYDTSETLRADVARVTAQRDDARRVWLASLRASRPSQADPPPNICGAACTVKWPEKSEHDKWCSACRLSLPTTTDKESTA